MRSKVKTINIQLHLDCGAYRTERSTPYLCLTELRQYVDMPPRAPRKAELTLTNSKPKGSNYHVFKWSNAQHDWTLRYVEGGSPGLYYGFTGAMNQNFARNQTIYAWLTC